MSLAIDETTVTRVVETVSARMRDPQYAQIAIGTFAQAHPDAGRFLTAHADELGGSEGVVHAVFHAQVLNECFREHLGRSLPALGFAVLDRAAADDPSARFARLQPALSSYVASNVDDTTMKRLLAIVGLAMHAVA